MHCDIKPVNDIKLKFRDETKIKAEDMLSKPAIITTFTVIVNAIMLIMVTVLISYRCTGRPKTKCYWPDMMDYMNASADSDTCVHSENTTARRLGGLLARIIGGKPIGISHVPSAAAMVVLKHDSLPQDSFQCGVTIIDRWWVVTTAHCIDVLQKSGFTLDHVVIASGNTKWNHGRKHPVKSVIMHSDFDEDELYDDIALMSVKKPFEGEYEQPATVAGSRYPYKPNDRVRVVGWGYTDEDVGQVQEGLRGVDITLISQHRCNELIGANQLSPSMVCAGDLSGGKDACQYDSGGPLYHENLLVGIASWGKGCGEEDQPGVYTRIGKFQKWITRKACRPKARIKFLHKP